MDTQEFLDHSRVILDVRSPSEFQQGHIPGAHSLPLLSDDERKQVGTCYKKEGKDAAICLGLELVEPKLSFFIDEAKRLASTSTAIRLYCFRGGMRSGSMAHLLRIAGLECLVLTGGYKAFRTWTLETLSKKYSLKVLGGFTGSGKTEILYQLQETAEQIIDLEKIANHRGSVFGHLGYDLQPSTQQFENNLALELSKLDSSKAIWIEDESRMIGRCPIPQGLWEQMKIAPLLWIDSLKEKRLERLVKDYGSYSSEELIFGVKQLQKKLGAVKTEEATRAIQNKELKLAISLILDYYDQSYSYACQKHKRNSIRIKETLSEQELIHQLKRSYE